MSLRVLLVAHHFLPRHRAGVEIYTDRLARELLRQGVDVAVCTTDDDPTRRAYELRERRVEGLRLFEIADPHTVRDPGDTLGNPAVLGAFETCLERFAPEVAHFQHVMFVGLEAPVRVAARGIPSLMTLHEYWLLCARHGQMLKEDGSTCSKAAPDVCSRCLTTFRFGRSPREVWARRVSATIQRATGLDPLPLLKLTRPGGRSRNLNSRLDLQSSESGLMLEFLARRRALVEALQSAVDHFLAPSRFLKTMFIEAGWPEEKIIYSPYGLPAALATRTPRDAGPLRVGFMGSLVPQKGAHVLLEAHRSLPEGLVSVAIFGDPRVDPGYARRLRRRSRRQEVRFSGSFAPTELGEALGNLDILVVPSLWYENAPLVISEAFAHGVPVVASRLGGMAEMVQDGVDGWLFTPGSSEELAQALSVLALDKGRLGRLSKGIVPRRSLGDDAQNLISLYEGLVR